MLESGQKILMDAKINKKCIPQFNINNLEWAKTILETMNDLQYPVILGVSEAAIEYMGGYYTVTSLVKGLIGDLNINIPVVLHLDHGKSIESCIKAIDSGFTSVMIDASKYSLEENIRMTSEVVKYAHTKGVMVEGELGSIGGCEDDINATTVYTNLDDAIRYVNETKVDSFAPSIGTAHGMDRPGTVINIELLKQLNEKINIPLVLHGGSGISDEQMVEMIRNGICKININTELQVEWCKQVREYLLRDNEVYDPRKIIGSGKSAMIDIIVNKVNLFR